MPSILCFYHAPCNDGAAAAAALEQRLLDAWDAFEDLEIRCCPLTYNTEWNDRLPASYLEQELHTRFPVSAIYFVDIAVAPVKFEQIYEYLRDCGRIHSGSIPVVCIDHHRSAMDRSDELRVYCTDLCIEIGEGLSGATLVWNYFNGQFSEDPPVPELLRYVADQDIWEWKLPDSQFVNAALNALNGTVDDMRRELAESTLDPTGWLQRRTMEGKAIMGMVDAQVLRAVRNVHEVRCDDWVMLVVNSTAFNSETGNYLCANHAFTPNALSCLYTIQEDFSVRCSLRSIDGGRIQARQVAEMFGGGGHDHAAGCRFGSFDEFRQMIAKVKETACSVFR